MGKAVNLLPCQIMPLCNLRYRRAAHVGRQYNLELLVVTPTPPFQHKNITTHYHPRIRHVIKDVVMHVP